MLKAKKSSTEHKFADLEVINNCLGIVHTRRHVILDHFDPTTFSVRPIFCGSRVQTAKSLVKNIL